MSVWCRWKANKKFAEYRVSQGYIDVDVTCSRTSGVAPLSVHFDAIPSTISYFHDMEFQWNFGDSESGTWHDGKSKNTAKGPVACHIFETPGNYTVTLIVKEGITTKYIEQFNVSVTDPDTYYSGTATTCVNESGDSDFTGAPSGCRQIQTDDLSTIVQYATSNTRILFKRGSSWTISSDLEWPIDVTGVTIGAYGTGTNPNALGIFDNAPYITIENDAEFWTADMKQDYRIMDLEFYNYDSEDSDANLHYGRYGYAIKGTYEMQRILVLRIKTYGCGSNTFSHYNTDNHMMNEQIIVACCDFENTYMENLYIGGERIAALGNNLHDNARSHCLRAWQAYKSVIQHNYNSGSSLDLPIWQQSALKFHGPREDLMGGVAQGNLQLEQRTEYAVISDNVFGGCGPWPVGIGPQNTASDERCSHIIIERNKFLADYGNLHSTLVEVGLHIWTFNTTFRNNILCGTGGDNHYFPVIISDRGEVPAQDNIWIYNNVIYRGDAQGGTHTGFTIWEDAKNVFIRNNIVSFPYATGSKTLIDDSSSAVTASNNLFNDAPGFIDPNNETPLLRDFSVNSESDAIDAGYAVPVYEDFDGNIRLSETIDIGAYEYGE